MMIRRQIIRIGITLIPLTINSLAFCINFPQQRRDGGVGEGRSRLSDVQEEQKEEVDTPQREEPSEGFANEFMSAVNQTLEYKGYVKDTDYSITMGPSDTVQVFFKKNTAVNVVIVGFDPFKSVVRLAGGTLMSRQTPFKLVFFRQDRLSINLNNQNKARSITIRTRELKGEDNLMIKSLAQLSAGFPLDQDKISKKETQIRNQSKSFPAGSIILTSIGDPGGDFLNINFLRNEPEVARNINTSIGFYIEQKGPIDQQLRFSESPKLLTVVSNHAKAAAQFKIERGALDPEKIQVLSQEIEQMKGSWTQLATEISSNDQANQNYRQKIETLYEGKKINRRQYDSLVGDYRASFGRFRDLIPIQFDLLRAGELAGSSLSSLSLAGTALESGKINEMRAHLGNVERKINLAGQVVIKAAPIRENYYDQIKNKLRELDAALQGVGPR